MDPPQYLRAGMARQVPDPAQIVPTALRARKTRCDLGPVAKAAGTEEMGLKSPESCPNER